MITIQLINLPFYAYHGIYEEEKTIGGEYEVNVEVSYHEKNNPVLHINETINYVSLYELLKRHMQKPKQLLETIATLFAADVFATFSEAEQLTITINKKHPPVASFEGSVAVNYKVQRSQ